MGSGARDVRLFRNGFAGEGMQSTLHVRAIAMTLLNGCSERHAAVTPLPAHEEPVNTEGHQMVGAGEGEREVDGEPERGFCWGLKCL